MLPTSGYFRGILCPDHQQNNCHRPYCHFHHGARKEQPSTSSATSSISKQDVDWREGITAEELSNASYSSATCEDEVPEESAGGASGEGQSDLLQQLVSEAVKKVLEENPGLASSTDTSLVMKSINTSALVAQATAAAVIPTATKKKKVYLRPPDTPSYNPTPIKELKKRKLSTEASFDYSTPGPKVVRYTPTPILTLAATTSDSQKEKNNKESVDSEVTDFSSEESDAEINKRNCDFDLLEEVLAEHSQNNKVKVKKKRVKALGKLKYNLSVLEKKVDKSVMISDAKNKPDSKLTTCIQPNKTPPREAPAEESYFLPPSPVFTSSSSVVNEVLNSIVYAKSSTMPAESEIVENVVCHEKTVQNVKEASDKKDSTDTVTCSTSTIYTEKQPVSSEAKTKSTCLMSTINTEKKPVSSEAKKKSKGHTHLPQVVHTLVAPKLSRPSVRSWTPQVRSASSETKKDDYPLDELLQIMDGGDDPKITEPPVKSSSVQEQKENIKSKKKYKVDLDKEIESLTKPSSVKGSGGKKDQTDSENISKSTKGKTRTLSSDEPKAADDLESKDSDTDNEKSESSNTQEEGRKSDACSTESDNKDDTHNEEGNTDSDQEKERHRKSKKRHRSSSESDRSRHRKRHKKNRKRRHKHSRSKKRKRHRNSTSGSEDSQEDAEETDQNTDVSDESNEEDKASAEKPSKHKKHKKYKRRKKSKYKKKKSKYKGKKKSKSYSSSRSSSRSRSVNTSRRNSRSSSEDSSRRMRSKEISNNAGKNSSRDSSEESRSRSSSKEHKRRSRKRKRKSLSKERSKDSNEERDSSSEERSRSSSKENTKNSSRERRKSISKERKESRSKERKESTNKERKEKLRKEKRESTSRERRESTSKGSRERNSKERRDSKSRERRESTNKGSRERNIKEKRDSTSRERRESTNKGSRERNSKEKRDSTSRDRRESLSKDRRDSHKEGSSKNSTKEKSKNSSKETIEGPESHKGRSSSKDKDSSSGRDKKESRDKDKGGAKKKESRSRSISDSHHRKEGDDKSQEHVDPDPPVSIPMPIDPSTIKQEKDVLVPDLSLVKTEKVEKEESSRVSSLLSEKSVPKESVSETGTKQGSNIKSNLECKSKSESTSHRRKKSTDSISDKSSHGRLSTDSRNSDNEALNERSPSSPEPQPRRLSMFDEIMASTVSKPKGLTEISMFDSAESSSGKLKSHKTYSSNVKSKRRSSGSVDSRSNINCEKSGDGGDSGTVGQDKEPPSDIIQHSNRSSSGQSSKHHHNSKHGSSSSNKHSSSSSSKHSSKHSSSNKHSSSISKHEIIISSSSSNKHGSSSSKHDSSGNKHGGGSSSSKHGSGSKHSSNSSSSSHKQSSRSEGKHKSSKVAGHSTPKASGAATGTAGLTPSGRSTVDTGTSSGISERDSFDYNGNESPLPDFSELDEIPHDDWEQIINSSNTPESHSKDNPDSDLDTYELDHENPDDVMEECMRMFDEFQPDPSRPDTQVSTRKQKCDSQTVEPELVTGKKRIARTSSTGNLIPKKPTYLQKVKLTPMQKMMERFNELKEINAKLEKRLKQPQEVQGESSAVSSSTNSASISPASSSTHITSPPGKKRRISHVPNVSSLLNAREKIKSLPPTSSRNLLSAKISKASGSIPRTTTIAQTIVKGGKRVAHVPKTEVLTRPIVPAEFGSKVPQNIRQRYLNTLIDECLKFCTEREAFNIGVAEERVCFQRSSSRMVYLSLAVNAVKRLRSQQMVGDAAQELIENEPQLFESSSKEEPSPSPQASTSSVSSTSKTSKTSGKPHPLNPNHVKVSHYTVLSGGGLKGSWSIEKPKKNTQTMGRLKDEALYKHLNRYMLTEELLGENGYPFPDPDEKGKAIVKTIDRRKKISPSCTERYCDRCSLLYYVDKWGFPVTTTSCCYHWGRSYKRRTYVGFESRYSCCDGDLQSGGCCLATTHVSQNYNPKKLRGYVRTIPKDVQGNDAGVYALDCEMSYTTGGCELTRVTVINSEGAVVYEQFVKPENPIIDYNTRFSGITESDMEDVQTSLRDVQASLLARFSEKTILIGHSLESDLHALKIIHDTVVDTSVVFPHKMGPPAKRALRNLASEYLKRIIQNDVSGHDSAEDAITCMDLMHWKIKEDLKGLK